MRDYRPDWLEQYKDDMNGNMIYRPVNNEEYIAIIPFIYTYGIIKGRFDNELGYEDRWCYHDLEAAKKAFDEWDGIGEPDGWHRHPKTGRRREGGDATTEYINP